jgi:hypothetical protein
MGEFPHFPAAVMFLTLWHGPVAIRACGPAPARARVGRVSGAVAADQPGPRSEPPGTAELLCALSFGSGLAAAERMEHGTNTAFVGVQLGHALGVSAITLLRRGVAHVIDQALALVLFYWLASLAVVVTRWPGRFLGR